MRNTFGSYNTTEPLRHFQNFHPDSKIGKEQLEKEEKKKRKLQNFLASAGAEAHPPPEKKKRVQGSIVKYAENGVKPGAMSIALAKAARWYMYGRQHIFKSTFDDDFFRDMISGYFEAGGGKGKVKYLTRKGLKYYVKGEFELFKMYLKHVIAISRKAAFGNRFAQGLHDGGTLSDKQKRLAVGIQFIDLNWEKNHVICLGMAPLSDASAGPTAELLRKLSLERMGVPFDDAVACLTQDKAGAAVAKAMEYEVDHCDMHQVSKISQSAVGVLVRKKDLKPVNPFPEGALVMKVAHDMGKYFSYSTRHSDLVDCCKAAGAAAIRVKLDVNGTRVTAQHGLLRSLLRLNKALKLFQMKYSPTWALEPMDWENIRFFEGILSIADEASKLSQHEKLFLGAISAVVKIDMLARLRRDEISVIDLEGVTECNRMPRVSVDVESLSSVSVECLSRARLEAERRFCGNKTEELNWKDYCPSERELGATLLDLRTVNANHLNDDQRKEAVSILKGEYVEFAKRAFEFKLEEKKEAEKAVSLDRAGTDESLQNNNAARAGGESASQASDKSCGGAESGNDLAMDAWGVSSDSDESEEHSDEMPDFEKEFDEIWKKWIKYAKKLDWKAEFPKDET